MDYGERILFTVPSKSIYTWVFRPVCQKTLSTKGSQPSVRKILNANWSTSEVVFPLSNKKTAMRGKCFHNVSTVNVVLKFEDLKYGDLVQ